jgi:hypothetical protein
LPEVGGREGIRDSLMGTELQFCKMERVLKVSGSDGSITM